MDINLKSLGLTERWPKLAKLQDEIRDLEKHRLEAESKAAQIRAGIPAARDKDLAAAASAIRSGAKPPKTSNEDEAEARLRTAERNRDVLQRAVENARTDYGHFLQQHRDALHRDVAEQRQEIAREAATAARTALQAYGRFEDLHYVLRGLDVCCVD